MTMLPRWLRRRDARSAAERHGYRPLLKDSVIYGGGRALIKVLHALLLPLYSFYLTPDDYGLLGIVLTTATLIDVFVTLGFDVAFTRFYFDERSEENHRRVITNVFYVKFLWGALLLGALALAMPEIAKLVTGNRGDAIYLDIALINIFFTNWSDLPYTLFRLDHRPLTFTFFTVGRVLVQVPVTVALVVWAGMGPMGVLVGNAVAAFVLNTLALPTYWKRLHWRPEWAHMWSMIRFAAPAIFTTLSFYLLKLSDRFFFIRYRTQAELGLYTVAVSLSQPVYLVMMAFRMAWPQWHYAKLDDVAQHKLLIARSSTYFLAFCLFMVTGMGVFMPLLVRLLLTKPAYWGVGPTTLVLAFSTIAYSAYFVFWVGSNVAKKNQLIPVIAAVSGGINVGLNFWAIPEFGMLGAACTTLLGYLLLAFQVYFISQHYYPIRYEWGRLLKLLAATAAALGVALGVNLLIGGGPQQPFRDMLWKQALTAPALAVFPAILWVSGFFTRGERARLAARRHFVWRRGARRAAVVARAGAAAPGTGKGPTGGLAPAPEGVDRIANEAEEEAEEREQQELEEELESDVPSGGGIV